MSRQLLGLFLIFIITVDFIYANSPDIRPINRPYAVHKQGYNFKQATDSWRGKDKLKHFSLAFYLTMSSYYYQNRGFNVAENKARKWTTFTVLSLGIGKEICDYYKADSHFSIKDLMADMSGLLIGLLLINRIE